MVLFFSSIERSSAVNWCVGTSRHTRRGHNRCRCQATLHAGPHCWSTCITFSFKSMARILCCSVPRMYSNRSSSSFLTSAARRFSVLRALRRDVREPCEARDLAIEATEPRRGWSGMEL